MSESSADTLEQVVEFASKGRWRSSDTSVEDAGQAIVATIQKAADLANENCDRALRLAHRLSMELRDAQDRINQLEAEMELFRHKECRAKLARIIGAPCGGLIPNRSPKLISRISSANLPKTHG